MARNLRHSDPACRQPASQQLIKGARLFNAGEYFECHEVLEELWLAERGAVRALYQGVLQVAVALLHRQRGNFKGATSLLESGLRHLAPFEPVCQQLDVARLRREARALLAQLQLLGPQRCSELDEKYVPLVWLRAESECEDETGGDNGRTQG